LIEIPHGLEDAGQSATLRFSLPDEPEYGTWTQNDPIRGHETDQQETQEKVPDHSKRVIVKHSKFWPAAVSGAMRTYRAARLNTRSSRDLPDPLPDPNEIRSKIGACGVCRSTMPR
jgi:hypothetical protein